MARPKGIEQGVRQPDRLRVGFDFPSFGGVNGEDDPGALNPSEFVKLVNVEHNGKKIVPRPGLAKLTDNALDGGKVYGLFDDHAGDVLGRSGPQLYVPSETLLLGYDRHTGVYLIPGTAATESPLNALQGAPRTQGVRQGLFGRDPQVLIGRGYAVEPVDVGNGMAYLAQSSTPDWMYTRGVAYSGDEIQRTDLDKSTNNISLSDLSSAYLIPFLCPGDGYTYFLTSKLGVRSLFRFPALDQTLTAAPASQACELLCSDTPGYTPGSADAPISLVTDEDGNMWASFGRLHDADTTAAVYKIVPGETFTMTQELQSFDLVEGVHANFSALVLVTRGNDIYGSDIGFRHTDPGVQQYGILLHRAPDGTWTKITNPADVDGRWGAYSGVVYDGVVYFAGESFINTSNGLSGFEGRIVAIDSGNVATIAHAITNDPFGAVSQTFWALYTDGVTLFYAWGGGYGDLMAAPDCQKLRVGSMVAGVFDDAAGGVAYDPGGGGDSVGCACMWQQGTTLFVTPRDAGGGILGQTVALRSTTLPLGSAWTDGIAVASTDASFIAPAYGPVAVAGGSAPTEHTVPFTRIGTAVGGVNSWLCDPTPTNDPNLVSYIGDNDLATRIYPPGTETVQFFGIDAPDIADGAPVTNVTLHVIPYVADGVTDGIAILGEAGLDGQADVSPSQFPIRNGVPMAFEIPRPGGGDWTGADLKNASLAFTAFMIWGNENNGHQPRITDMWLTYVA